MAEFRDPYWDEHPDDSPQKYQARVREHEAEAREARRRGRETPEPNGRDAADDPPPDDWQHGEPPGADGTAKANGGHDKPGKQYAGRIKLLRFDQIMLGTQRRDLVKGLMPRIGLIVIWGPPKCCKSFWTFDLVMHVARGIEYRGRRVQQGAVVYCAFEGQTGIQARKEAYRQRHLNGENPSLPFYLQPLTLDLVADHAELIEAIRAQLDGQNPACVVLDTLNRSLRGSESSDDDMAAYVRAADHIREAFQCAVIIVHHCGLDGSRPRGHTSLRGASDAELSVIRDASENIVAKVELAKDGPQGDEIISRLEVVEVGRDEDGEPITSCVVIPADSDPTAKTKLTAPLTPEEKAWLKDIVGVFAEPDSVQIASPASHMAPLPIVTRNVTRDGLKARGRFDLDRDGNLTGADRERLRRMLNKLGDKGKIGMTDKFVWLIKERH